MNVVKNIIIDELSRISNFFQFENHEKMNFK